MVYCTAVFFYASINVFKFLYVFVNKDLGYHLFYVFSVLQLNTCIFEDPSKGHGSKVKGK